MKKEKEKRSKTVKKGFTLIEMLVVVLIIGVLAAIALPQYYYAVNVTKVKTKMTTLRAIADASERYALVNGEYPTYANASASDSVLNKQLDISVPDYQYVISDSEIVIWDLSSDMRIGYAFQEMPKVPAKKFFCYYSTAKQGLPGKVKEKICKKVCNTNDIISNFPSGSHKGCIIN